MLHNPLLFHHQVRGESVAAPSNGIAAGGETAAAQKSSADWQFLHSLDAKIKELTEAGILAPSAAPAVSAAVAQDGSMAEAVNDAAKSPCVATAIDSTQTVRPLTFAELEASEASRWFAIELMVSAVQIDSAQIPNLAIFEEYKLYSVAGAEHGSVQYALRLGFFLSEIAAAAVLRYLAGYFASATLKRVSIAERERFAATLIAAGKDVGGSGKRLAVEIVGATTAVTATKPLL